jgi:hypothetical protein
MAPANLFTHQKRVIQHRSACRKDAVEVDTCRTHPYGVLARRIELLIGVKDRLQRAVSNPRDVADRIVGVVQILNRGGVLENFRRPSGFDRRPRGLQMEEAECLLVILVRRLQAVGVAESCAGPSRRS